MADEGGLGDHVLSLHVTHSLREDVEHDEEGDHEGHEG